MSLIAVSAVSTPMNSDARPRSGPRCVDFLVDRCTDTMNGMLWSAALISSLAMPVQAGTFCPPNSQLKDMLNVVEKAAVPDPKDDPRFGLHEGAPMNGISPEEAKRLAQVSGKVRCPASKTEWGACGNGFLVSSDTILTNAHIPKDNTAKFRLKDMSACYFATSDQPDVRYPLKLDDQHAKFGTSDWPHYKQRDFVMVRLTKPVSGVRPLRLSASAGALGPTD